MVMSLAWPITKKTRHFVEWRGKWKVNQDEKAAYLAYWVKKNIVFFKAVACRGSS